MAKVGWGPEMLTQHLQAAVPDLVAALGVHFHPCLCLVSGALTGTPALSSSFVCKSHH